MLKAAVSVLALFAALPALAGELRVPLQGHHQDLVIDLPAGWQSQIRRPRPDLPPTISITAADSRSLQVLITPMWSVGAAKPPTPEALRALVKGAADKAQTQAVEPELKLHELGVTSKYGYYFSATDRQPEPGGYKYLTQGALGLEELTITFTVLVNGQPQEPTAHALELLRSMRRSTAASAP